MISRFRAVCKCGYEGRLVYGWNRAWRMADAHNDRFPRHRARVVETGS